jgi:hypothetical protein
MRGGFVVRVALVAACVVAASVLAATRAAATTLPETTFFINITLTDKKLILARKSVKPGSLVVFTVRNKSSQPRRLVFGNFKTGLMAPGQHKRFELNFLVPWQFMGVSTDKNGAHRVSARFVCSW